MSILGFDSIKETTEKAVGFVEWLAQLLRGRNWVTMLLLLDVLVVLFFNPFASSKILGFFPIAPALPEWYRPVFWGAVVVVFIAAFVVAYRTVPRKTVASAANLIERKALKGLRPFGFEDAEIFARLQREQNLRECLETITDKEFRFGILCGESGCGKTSFLQAGLWPGLQKWNHPCAYVKFSDLQPLASIRQALAEKLPQENPIETDLLSLLQRAAPAGSRPLVLLLDQFEQFFVHPKAREEREPFVQALAEWYKRRPPLPVKVLLCLRDDFYGRLIELQKAMGYSLGPQQSFRLEKFTPQEATEIFRVIAATEDLAFDEDFVQELAEQDSRAGKMAGFPRSTCRSWPG